MPKTRFFITAFLLLALTYCCTTDSNTNWISGVEPDDGQYTACALKEKRPFAQYRSTTLTYDLNLPTYDLPMDLTQVVNLDRDIRNNPQFDFDATAEANLESHGLVLLPGTRPLNRFDKAYQALEQADMPILITTDSALHLYHLYFVQVLKSLEVRELLPMLRALLKALAHSLSALYNALDGDLKEAARRDLAVVYSAIALLGMEGTEIPSQVSDEVVQVVQYIESAGQDLKAGRAPNPIFNRDCSRDMACTDKDLGDKAYEQGRACYCEDYTQYEPRGHYTESDELKRYFRTVRFLSQWSMRLKSPMETRMAVLFTAALNKSMVSISDEQTPAALVWDRIYRTILFFTDASDDLTFVEYDKALREVYTKDFSIQELSDKDKLERLRQRLKQDWESAKPNGFKRAALDNTTQTMGLRFLGQGFSFDTYALGQLVFDQVGPNPDHELYAHVLDNLDADCKTDIQEDRITGNFDQCDGQSQADWSYICCSALALSRAEKQPRLAEVCRYLPSGLDVAAIYGSERAEVHEKGQIEGYCGYRERLDSLRKETRSFTESDWWKSLQSGWMFALQPLFNKEMTGFPIWMTTDRYRDKSLSTALASWAELRRDTIHYVTAITPGGITALPPKDLYWVEPIPELYAALSDLAKLTRTGLTDMGMLNTDLDASIDELVELLDELTSIAIHELEGEQLSLKEKVTIEFMGQNMQRMIDTLAKVSNLELETPVDGIIGEERMELKGDPYQTPIIADVYGETYQNKVLEVGSGYIDWMVVVRRIDDETLGAVIGPVFSYYEFSRSMQNRLNDDEWRQLLDGSKLPARPQFVRASLGMD